MKSTTARLIVLLVCFVAIWFSVCAVLEATPQRSRLRCAGCSRVLDRIALEDGANPGVVRILPVHGSTPQLMCPSPSYARFSQSGEVDRETDYVELDTDSGIQLNLSLPAVPHPLERHEFWMSAQVGAAAAIDPQGKTTTGASLVLDEPNEGRLLLFVKPSGQPGYWRVTEL